MKYNTGKKYNFPTTKDGLIYNSSQIQVLIKLFDVFYSKESSIKIAAQRLITEKISASDIVKLFVLQPKEEILLGEDAMEFSALLSLVENQPVSDYFYKILVLLKLTENQKLLDQIYQLEVLLKRSDEVNAIDASALTTLMSLSDKYSLEEAKELIALIQKYENVPITDRDARKAVSDFLIGLQDGYDSAYDWIFPFEMKVDWRNSSIQVMPQTESSYIDEPGVDGSIIEDTIYKNRMFSIVAFSELGLSVYEKEQLKRDITQILDSTKNNPKKMTFQSSNTAFDVQYSGGADIQEGPSYVKATIPFEASPYGYPLFEKELFGSGLLVNDGDADSGCVHYISSGAANPQFQLGTITYKWSGTVPSDTTLVIDQNNLTCYLETVAGQRTNAISSLTGEFQTIPKHSSLVLTATASTESYIRTVLQEKILWMGD